MRVPSLPHFLLAAASAVLLTNPVLAQRGGGRGGAGGATAVQPPRFDYVGPDNGGRIASVAGIPGDTMTYYFGAASGGVWKTIDGARTFAPVFDDQSSQAIGALAVAPSSPRTVWAGTGEAWAIRDADVMGDGVYKSTDAGATWTNMGLVNVGRIGKIIVHPTNADLVYVCALGRATGPQQERGVYRTKDGGTNWERVLFVNENTGCSGLSIDRTHPENLVAGTWEVVMKTYAMTSGGAGSGVYVSHDSGSTWTRATDAGLPKSPLGKIDVAIAPSNSKRVYALIQTPNQGSVWRSDDGGNKWKVVSWDRSLIGRAGYYIRIDVNPENDLEVLVANSTFKRSYDGGETWPIIDRGCGDCHDIWMDPRNPSHYVITGDGGAGITTNHGVNFTQFALPIGQMYHVAIDDQMPYWIYANKQDDSRSVRAPSSARMQVANVPSYGRGGAAGAPGAPGGFGGGGGRGASGASPWQGPLGGCESGFTIPQPGNSDIVWATCYGNTVTRYDDKIGEVHSVSPWRHTLDFEPNNSKYRCHWTPPLAIDPFDPKTVYYGCQVIFKTQNAGQSWSVISPDLSTQDPRYVVSSGGIVGDNLGQFYGEVVFAIAPSEKQRGLIWAGTNDGKIWNTTDGGTKWNDLTMNVSGLAPWGTVRKIEPSRFDAGTAYVVVDYHMMDDRKPYIYKTADYGKSWSLISASLPQDHPLSYAMSVAENPNRKGMLFAGTGHQLFYSMDDGAKWTEMKAGLPASPASWITINKQQHDLVVSTYGRGLWVLRDMTVLEQSDKQVADAPIRIYEPRPGLRQARTGGAEVTFTLQDAPKDSLSVQIADSSGAVIRTIRTMARAGTNRVAWDLRYDSPKQPELRTTPVDNPHIWDEPRYKEHKKTRIVDHWGIAGVQRAGALAAPGKYSVKINAAGATVTQPFVVVKDPKLGTSATDLAAATGAQVRAVNAINGSVDIINRIEIMRKQIEDLVASDATAAADRTALLAEDKKALEVELLLLSKAELNSDDKWFTERHKLYMSLLWLSAEVGTGAGDVAGGAEYRPTDAQSQTLGELEKDLIDAKAAFAKFMGEVKAFNAAHAGLALSDELKAERSKAVVLP
jgi:photosystem II stability/assembly factor-like uncharacterized protein